MILEYSRLLITATISFPISFIDIGSNLYFIQLHRFHFLPNFLPFL